MTNQPRKDKGQVRKSTPEELLEALNAAKPLFTNKRTNKRIPADLLRRIRNDLPMPVAIAPLGPHGPPRKMSEGYFRFLCPHCGEMRATVNPRNNLAHCFTCKKNLNTIDLLMSEGYDFLSAVALLKRWLDEFQANQPQTTAATQLAKQEKQSTPPTQCPQ